MYARFALLATIAIGCKSPADVDETETDLPVDENPIIAAFESERTALNAHGVSFAIWYQGDIILSHGLGQRGPDEDASSPTGQTLFRIGSVTKMLTATAMLQQVEDERAALQTPLSDYLPDLQFAKAPSRTSILTAHQLLTHQGGFYDWTETNGSRDDTYLKTYAETRFAQNVPFIAPSGAFHNYANPNYLISGYAIEVVDNERFYPDLLNDEVLQPLGMTRSYFHGDDVIADGDYAIGRTVDWTGQTTDVAWADPNSYDHAAQRPAGFLWSSAEQLLAFAEFLIHGQSDVLEDSTRALLVEPHVDTLYYPNFQHYGYGINVNRGFMGFDGFYETPVWEHSGAIYGFSAQLTVLPEHDFAIAVLSNSDGAYYGQSVATAVESTITTLPTPTERPDPEIDPTSFERYEGQYIDALNVGTLNFTATDGQLMVDAPTLEEYDYTVDPVLTPLAKDNFALTVNGNPLRITFVDGEDGTSAKYLRNRIFVATRQDNARPPQPMAIDPIQFDRALKRTPPPLMLPDWP